MAASFFTDKTAVKSKKLYLASSRRFFQPDSTKGLHISKDFINGNEKFIPNTTKNVSSQSINI